MTIKITFLSSQSRIYSSRTSWKRKRWCRSYFQDWTRILCSAGNSDIWIWSWGMWFKISCPKLKWLSCFWPKMIMGQRSIHMASFLAAKAAKIAHLTLPRWSGRSTLSKPMQEIPWTWTTMLGSSGETTSKRPTKIQPFSRTKGECRLQSRNNRSKSRLVEDSFFHHKSMTSARLTAEQSSWTPIMHMDIRIRTEESCSNNSFIRSGLVVMDTEILILTSPAQNSTWIPNQDFKLTKNSSNTMTVTRIKIWSISMTMETTTVLMVDTWQHMDGLQQLLTS